MKLLVWLKILSCSITFVRFYPFTIASFRSTLCFIFSWFTFCLLWMTFNQYTRKYNIRTQIIEIIYICTICIIYTLIILVYLFWRLLFGISDFILSNPNTILILYCPNTYPNTTLIRWSNNISKTLISFLFRIVYGWSGI
jgi:hypothetical protein